MRATVTGLSTSPAGHHRDYEFRGLTQIVPVNEGDAREHDGLSETVGEEIGGGSTLYAVRSS